MSKYLIGLLLGILLIVSIGVAIAPRTATETRQGGSVDTVFINDNFTAASVGVSTTRQRLLAGKSDRVYAKLCNPSADATVPIWLYLTSASTTVAVGSSTPLNARGTQDNCFVIGSDFFYPGEVWGISNSTTAINVSIIEN